MGVAGAIISAIGIAVQYKSSQSAQKESKRQHEESTRLSQEGQAKQQQLADLQTMRAKRAAVRDAQQRRSEVAAAAEQRGVNSSVIQGAQASFGTQASSQVSFLDSANRLSGQAASLFGQAHAIGTRPIMQSTLGAGITALGSTIFGARKELGDLFSPSPTSGSVINFSNPTVTI